MPGESNSFTKDFIEAGLKLSERDLLRERFILSAESPLPAGPRLTAADHFPAELLADPDKAAAGRPFFNALGLDSAPGADDEPPAIFPWTPDFGSEAALPLRDKAGGQLCPYPAEPFERHGRPGGARPPRGVEISEDYQPLLDFQGRTAALLAGAALAGTAALSEDLLHTRTLDGRPILWTGGREPNAKAGPGGSLPAGPGEPPGGGNAEPLREAAVRLPDEADRVLVLGFVRAPEIMGMNPGLSRLRPPAGWLNWPGQVRAVLRLAERLTAGGWLALPSAGGLLKADLAGVLAGLGELGRQGLLITPEYGPNLRLFTILTDYPFTVGRSLNFGVADYCATCRRCIGECPAQALAEGPRRPETRRWPVNSRACFDHWLRKGDSCRKCLEVCPYTKEPLVGSPGGSRHPPPD